MSLKIKIYQVSPILGDIIGNQNKLVAFYNQHSSMDVIVTPELSLSGYSPLDNLFSYDFQETINASISNIMQNTLRKHATLLLGTPYFQDNQIFNAVLVIYDGQIRQVISKTKLPNYGVFNEERYFAKSSSNNIININDIKIGLFICEDMWHMDKVQEITSHNPNVLISINASPFEHNKNHSRVKLAQSVLQSYKSPIIYVNIVGGVDDIVFDGASFIMDKYGQIIGHLQHCEEDYGWVVVDKQNNIINNSFKYSYPQISEELIYSAITRGLQDFIKNSGKKGVLLGLSGGIDSTISATLAADTLGSENIVGISMPSKYTSVLSKQIINEIKSNLKIQVIEIPIDSIVTSYTQELDSHLNLASNNILENIQARVRGQILMAFANQYQDYFVLTTGNKSEIATGYYTLYGDSCGAFNLIKDLYKTEVFNLAKWRNNNIPHNAQIKKTNLIPALAITRPPSAELKDNQSDEASLMSYDILDKILFNVIEKNAKVAELYSMFAPNLVNKVLQLLKHSQHKRIQGAIGIKLSKRPFGKDFLYNLTDKYQLNKKS